MKVKSVFDGAVLRKDFDRIIKDRIMLLYGKEFGKIVKGNVELALRASRKNILQNDYSTE